MANRRTLTDKSRMISVRFHEIRKRVERDELNVQYGSTNWQLVDGMTKGLAPRRHSQTFQHGKDFDEVEYTPPDDFKIPLSGFKIRYKDAVLKMLQKTNPSKSANGVPPRFWKECAELLAPSVTKLYRHIVKKKRYVSRWKEGRVSAPHKRGSMKDAKNYRPLKVVLRRISLLVLRRSSIHNCTNGSQNSFLHLNLDF